MIDGLAVGLVLGLVVALLTYRVGRAQGFAAHRALTRPAPTASAPDAAPPPVVEYAITRDGRKVWYGSDPHEARNWWEHQKQTPGPRELLFTVDGVVRDRFHVSA